MVKKISLLFVVISCILINLTAQENNKESNAKPDAKSPSISFPLKMDSSVITKHEIIIKGQRILYKAIAGTEPVLDEDGKPIASVLLYLL